jgi:hypothetical protein
MITFKKYLTELKAVVRDGTPKRPYYFKRNDKNDILDANIQHRELSKKIPSLNDGEPRHIKEYKNSSEINSKLRNSARKLEDKDDIEHVKYLDAVTSHKTDKDMHVYRGFKNNFQIHNLHPGHIIHDKGYTGTSLEYNVARGEGLSILNKSKIKNIVKNKKIMPKFTFRLVLKDII